MVHSILFVAVALSIVSATNYVAAFTPRRGLSCTGRKPLSSQIQPISSVPPTFHSQKQFHELGFSSSIIETVKSLGIESPSKIQAIAAHGLSSGHHCIIADQTGSGKTLAYLLPTLQRMLLITRKNSQVKRVSPYMVVLAPTTELAIQVSTVVKALANALKFRTACFTSSSDLDAEKRKLRLGADVLVSTPGRLLQLLERKEVDLSEVAAVVLDEADVLLMDETFPLQPIGQACGSAFSAGTPSTRTGQGRGSTDRTATRTRAGRETAGSNSSAAGSATQGTQFIFVTATLPEVVVRQIQAEFPDVVTLSGPGLHRVAPTVEEVLMDCSGPPTQQYSLTQVLENKRRALLRALTHAPMAQRTLVFCNTIEQCRRVENMLRRGSGKSRDALSTPVRARVWARGRGGDRRGDPAQTQAQEWAGRSEKVEFSTYCYHSAIDPKAREANLREFCRPLLRQPAVLVCTDRASRGMDFHQAQVDHVILFDFPQEPSEYLRRVGRTGRAGRKGKATVLVYGKQLPAARAVMRLATEGKRIQPSDSL